jgi:pyruvate dehydrogenase E2 component (dihydrolipoamide acetyltransferase)
MAYEVILPKLGQTVEEGRIVEWLKEEGDQVDRGEVLFTVETDKAVLDVEATRKGYLRNILFGEGELLPVLTVVAYITRTADEPVDVPVEEAGVAVPEPVAEVETAAEVEPEVASNQSPQQGRIFASPRAKKYARENDVDLAFVDGSGPNGRIIERDVQAYLAAAPKATPVAQRVAEQLGIDLRTVTGTGPQGRITKADVQAVVAMPEPAVPEPVLEIVAPPPARPALKQTPLTGIRGIIAQRMHQSHTTTAPVTLTMEVDATDLVKLREQLKVSLVEELGFNLGYNELLFVMVAKALRKFPYVNSRIIEDTIHELDEINIGVAIDTERGLLVPNVRDVDKKGLLDISREIKDLVSRGRVGRSLPDELTGGTFTITNMGMLDVDAFTPIINYPEAAILGVGRIKDVPAVYKGEITIRKMMWLSLTVAVYQEAGRRTVSAADLIRLEVTVRRINCWRGAAALRPFLIALS